MKDRAVVLYTILGIIAGVTGYAIIIVWIDWRIALGVFLIHYSILSEMKTRSYTDE